jgi:plasmid maintenance system antidote protein VapI
MSARPARSVQSVLRESVAAMSDRQIGLAATEIGVSRATLTAFAEGRSSLPDHCLHRLAERLYKGAYLIKWEQRA